MPEHGRLARLGARLTGADGGDERPSAAVDRSTCCCPPATRSCWRPGSSATRRSAPDEAGHYLRAIGIGNRQPIGEPSDYRDPGRSPKQLAFSRQTAREVSVPAGLAPDYFGCNAFLPELSAGCQRDVPTPPARVLRATHVGAYLPLPYLLPAAAIRAGDGRRGRPPRTPGERGVGSRSAGGHDIRALGARPGCPLAARTRGGRYPDGGLHGLGGQRQRPGDRRGHRLRRVPPAPHP